ncbi:flavin-dependent oxidoreductase [Noviherbaspirillum sp. CPCC 100848]|uniref:Flavin-dependent oxidoreductase n=1 Tax=Noviherbaspirillum album TaxID=3080276 RepID=A0ABU6JFY5_9BURK|nr:flavin-dependent oxidoreductase [Noviherbaspirillum sp. CPCC 100848]MEC4722328.1 flavin-dependent oxidoreductase [Noviherbaspirillum sp. CPCC 100848]
MKVAIAGAGIGGLTLGLMLHERGIEVEIFEAVNEIRPLGVGINLLPHASQQLCQLGLEQLLAEKGIETSTLAYFNKFGQEIWREPRGRAAGYPFPQFSIHRGELQMTLLQIAIERIGADRIHAGHAFSSFRQVADKVVSRFTRRADGSDIEVESDVLVGADGIHSAVRRFLYPSGDEPRFSGRMLWRAVTEGEPYMDGRSMFMAGHQDQKFVCYPISEPLRKQGRSLINWIAELRVPNGELPKTDWNRKVDKSVFEQAFQNWKWDWIDIPSIIDGATEIYEFPLVDRDILPRWTYERVTLLGDAAHPMYPIGSNGSAQAILDARYLCDCLAGDGNTTYALREYEAERLPRTAGIVLRNRMNGPEQVMQLAEERAPHGFKNVNDVIPQQTLESISLRYKRLAGFDKDSLRS